MNTSTRANISSAIMVTRDKKDWRRNPTWPNCQCKRTCRRDLETIISEHSKYIFLRYFIVICNQASCGQRFLFTWYGSCNTREKHMVVFCMLSWPPWETLILWIYIVWMELCRLLEHHKTLEVCRLEYLKTSRMPQYSNTNTFHNCLSLELVFQSDASEY